MEHSFLLGVGSPSALFLSLGCRACRTGRVGPLPHHPDGHPAGLCAGECVSLNFEQAIVCGGMFCRLLAGKRACVCGGVYYGLCAGGRVLLSEHCADRVCVCVCDCCRLNFMQANMFVGLCCDLDFVRRAWGGAHCCTSCSKGGQQHSLLALRPLCCAIFVITFCIFCVRVCVLAGVERHMGG